MLSMMVAAAMATEVCGPRTRGCGPPPNVWRINFEQMSDGNLHWSAPSYVELNTADGSYVFYASHLANMQRTKIWDDGQTRRLIVKLYFYGATDCTGSQIGAETRVVYPALGYKRVVNHYWRQFPGDRDKALLWQNAKCARAERVWDTQL